MAKAKNDDFAINKNDRKHLSKLQIQKAQFLFENDYFIWNEAEMYLRYHDIFLSMSSSSDALYERVCKTTRVIFNLIHDVHFKDTGSNAAHLKFYEVLDAWGCLSEYLKRHDKFPKPFIDWFQSIFDIYSSTNEINGQKVKLVSHKHLTCLYLICGVNSLLANQAFNKITFDLKYQLTFDHLLNLIKSILVSDERKHYSYLLVPKLQEAIEENSIRELPFDDVIRNYDYFDKKEHVYSNLSEYTNNSNKTFRSKKSPEPDEASLKEMISEAVTTTSGFGDLNSTATTQPTLTITIKKQRNSSIPVPITKTKTPPAAQIVSDVGSNPNTSQSQSNNSNHLPLALFTLNSNQVTYSLNNSRDKITIKSSHRNSANDFVLQAGEPFRNRCSIGRKSSSINELNKIQSSLSSLNNSWMGNNSPVHSRNNGMAKAESTFSLNEFRQEFKKVPRQQYKLFNTPPPMQAGYERKMQAVSSSNDFHSQSDLTSTNVDGLLRRKRFSSLSKIVQLQQMKANNERYSDRGPRLLASYKKHNEYVRNTLHKPSSSCSSSSSSSLSSISSASHSNALKKKSKLAAAAAAAAEQELSGKGGRTRGRSLRRSLEISLTNEDEANQERGNNCYKRFAYRANGATHPSAILSSVDTLYDIDDEENNNDEYDVITSLTQPSSSNTQNHNQAQTSKPSAIPSIQPHLFSVNDYKLMYEIIRKIKPYINNCIKLEVRNYFEKLIQTEHNKMII